MHSFTRMVLCFAFALLNAACLAQGSAQSVERKFKSVVVSAQPQSDSVIAVPPYVYQTYGKTDKPHPGSPIALMPSLEAARAINGLDSANVSPWHIVVSYDQFDEDGDNNNSGIYEEYWTGPKKYRRSYRSDALNQTDVATDHGLYRVGDQKWLSEYDLETNVRARIVVPFAHFPIGQDARGRKLEQVFGGSKLPCLLIDDNPKFTLSTPVQYCFDTDNSTLRYSRDLLWHQAVYNDIFQFQGRNLARSIVVTAGGKPYLDIRIEKLEELNSIDEAVFTPPKDSVAIGSRIFAPLPRPRKQVMPSFPPTVRGQRLEIEVELLIGKDGRVKKVHATGGPAEARWACEDAYKQWLFEPFLVLGEPVEVEAKTEFMLIPR